MVVGLLCRPQANTHTLAPDPIACIQDLVGVCMLCQCMLHPICQQSYARSHARHTRRDRHR